ncbi:hypothetical protein [Streptomyces leeuwenhoekii]|uniref:hypothetical protein n=1 Tax=Streptomyces leeuwenhoekii TaxID=1437453 RepID=UPI000AC1E3C9|nr:hypothetical protein [Streptomyces leeuwenhoekii]
MSTTVHAPAERAVSLVLEAEVTTDLDTGRLALVASTDHHMSDLDEVSPARLRALVADARQRLDEIERLAAEHEARVLAQLEVAA